MSVDPTLDPGLVSLSSSLVMVARNVSVPGDLPAIIDLLTQSVDLFLRGGNYTNTTFSVSLLIIIALLLLYYYYYTESDRGG